MKLNLKILYADFSNKKEMFDFSNCSAKPKYYDSSNKLVVVKMKNKTTGVVIEEFVGLKPKMYSYLVDEISEHRKAKGVSKNVVVAISNDKNKDVLLNKKYLRHSVNKL